MEIDPEISKRIGELIAQRKCFNSLPEPVLSTNGHPIIYYVNSENFLGDEGTWKSFRNDSRGMIEYVSELARNDEIFREVTSRLKQIAQQLIPRNGKFVISGGQTRDWLFSGPVAALCGLDHLSLYKDGRAEIVSTRPRFAVSEDVDIERYGALHIVDLLTEGSSCYRVEERKERGWIPMLRGAGADVQNLIAVISRREGGEENLAQQRVRTHSLFELSEEFLRGSPNAERDIDYFTNPREWRRRYLISHGALAFVEKFDPDAGDRRAAKFLIKYEEFLRQAERWKELERAVKREFNYSIGDLIGEAA